MNWRKTGGLARARLLPAITIEVELANSPAGSRVVYRYLVGGLAIERGQSGVVLRRHLYPDRSKAFSIWW
jgi:hypothetical protein